MEKILRKFLMILFPLFVWGCITTDDGSDDDEGPYFGPVVGEWQWVSTCEKNTSDCEYASDYKKEEVEISYTHFKQTLNGIVIVDSEVKENIGYKYDDKEVFKLTLYDGNTFTIHYKNYNEIEFEHNNVWKLYEKKDW